jgi:hypothetical protein
MQNFGQYHLWLGVNFANFVTSGIVGCFYFFGEECWVEDGIRYQRKSKRCPVVKVR